MTLFNPLSKDEIKDLFAEIHGELEAEFEDNIQQTITRKNDTVPTVEAFDKSEILKILRALEPNSIVFSQDIQKLLQMYLHINVTFYKSEDAEMLLEKYMVGDQKCDVKDVKITLYRIAAVFPSLTCNLLKCNMHIARPVTHYELSKNESYPRVMTTRCFFSLIPLTPLRGKLKIIEAALLYQLSEQAKFNTVKMKNGEIDYATHMKICLDYCSDDYLSEFEANEKRIKYFNELELMQHSFPIRGVYEAAQRLNEIVGNKWTAEVVKKFSLGEVDIEFSIV